MTFEKLEKFYEDVQKSRKKVSPELYPLKPFSSVSFSRMLEGRESCYIYIKNEKIPITEKNPEFKTILRHELSKSIKDYAESV